MPDAVALPDESAVLTPSSVAQTRRRVHRAGRSERSHAPVDTMQQQGRVKLPGGPSFRFSVDAQAGTHIGSKTRAEDLARTWRDEIRGATFRRRRNVVAVPAVPALTPEPDVITLERFGGIYAERLGRPVSRNHQSCVRQLVAFPLSGRPFGQKALAAITDGDLEAFMAHLHADGYTVSSRNKFIQTIKALFRWATKKGYVMRNPALDSDALKRGKPAKRTRRLEPRRRGQPAEAREPAPTTADHRGVGDRVSQGELLKLQWRDVSLTRRLITIQTAKAKTKTSRDIPISARLAGVLEMGKTDPMGKNFEADDYVFGDALGRPITDIKKAWETCVLKAHGQTPSWDRRNALSPASCQ